MFEGDNTMGSAADYGSALLRDVSLRIDGSFQSLLPSWGYDNNADGIKTLLNSKGWIVEQVDNVSPGYFPGVSGFSYNVYAVVGSNYSDRQIQDQIRRDLSGYFNVTGVSTLSAPWTPVVNGGNLGTVNVYGGSSQPTANYAGPVPPAGTTVSTGSSGVLSNLGLGLGISTPIAIAGGALLLVLLLKK